MRTAIKVLWILAMVWVVSPAWANCPFSLPMLQGGDTGLPPGALLTAAADVNGFFWELGFGDPEDGLGNDGNSLVTGYPAFTHAIPSLRWIKGVSGAREVDYDWANNGVDNCISGGPSAIASTVLVYYILDSNDNYALAALQGTSTPVAHNTLDLLVTGVGANGNDVPLVSLTAGVRAVLSNVVIVDSETMMADVAPAVEGINLFFDAAGPYDGIVSTEGMTLWSGGVQSACDPTTGCDGVLLGRGSTAVWDGFAQVIAYQSEGPVFCEGGVLDGSPCGSVDDPSGFCALQGGVCPPAPVVTTPFGPPILGGVPGGRDCQYDINESLTLTAVGTSVLLEWEAHPEAQGYQVFRCEPTSSPCAPQPLATTQDLFFVDDAGNVDQVWYNVTAVGYPCPANESCEHSRCWGDGVCVPDSQLPFCQPFPPFCGCDGMDYSDSCNDTTHWYSGTCQ